MAKRFRHVAIVGKHQAPGIKPVLQEIAQFLCGQGLDVSLDSDTALNTGLTDYDALSHDELGRVCDLAVVVGGDGTMLGFAREMAPYGIPLLGINQGRLGFITDIPTERWRESLAPVLAGDYEVESRAMLEGAVLRDGEAIFTGLALNDVVVSRGATAGMVELKIEVGEQFVANMRADGLIVASPTGSTAYALSAGGPLLHPSIAGWLLVPIAPHTLSNRPIVLPDSGEVRMEIVAGRDASVNFDMQSLASLLHGDTITVRRSQHQVRFLHPKGWSYYATLRRKLRWYL
ncbi:NAD kinase [Roseateles saccharophilus]|uniref:NAD kinase n=1 Tax=Roseateles saccharophilus TaxID=304 RepID=A0A4R3UU21_ROSSA|nr:NAD kinase [Roseateles saccharophilus]MDG0833289.1 NAD kinase [Roseateles saccharophilus]TCU94360.1 NAD+ kinase [Roseateles saccharophilus]